MFPSKEIVSYFYCKWTGQKDKLVSHPNVHHPVSKVFNHLRKEQVERQKILPCFFKYFVSNKVDLRAAKIKQLEKFFEENFRREEDF